MSQRQFTTYRTHHGPIVREADGKWVAIRIMEEPLKALAAVVGPYESEEPAGVPEGDGAAHELVEQHAVRRPRRERGVPALELRPAPRSEVRVESSGRRQRSGDRLEGRARRQREPERHQPEVRLGLQHQQLSVYRGGSGQPEADRLSAVHGRRFRKRTRHPRDPPPEGQEGLHAEFAHGGRVRQLPAGVRAVDSAAGEGVRCRAGGPRTQGQAARADRPPAQLGLSLGR